MKYLKYRRFLENSSEQLEFSGRIFIVLTVFFLDENIYLMMRILFEDTLIKNVHIGSRNGKDKSGLKKVLLSKNANQKMRN